MSPRSILVNARKSAPSSQLTLGGNRIRTLGPTEKETAVERGPAADHRRLARRPVLNDPIQLIGPASLVGNSRETLHKSGTDGSNPVPSSGESCEPRNDLRRGRRGTAAGGFSVGVLSFVRHAVRQKGKATEIAGRHLIAELEYDLAAQQAGHFVCSTSQCYLAV